MPLTVRDSLTGRPGPVAVPRGRPLTLYVCGPTVYDAAHVGHARTYLVFDVVRRWLEDQGVAVRHVMNVTDVEDKITDRARALGITWRELARREERGFLRDLGALGLLPPHATPRASEHVPEIARVVRRLERLGPLDPRPDGLYYRPRQRSSYPNFAAGQQLARHAVPEPGRPFPTDPGVAREFLVWKPQDRPAPSWPSRWGPGVPGWHLECFALAERYAGLPVDLHGGGTDLIYPHHFSENEVAHALGGVPFARRFLHTAFVTTRGRKMSKSAGNLVPLRMALRDAGASGLRWYLLGRPPETTIEWNPRALARARADAELLRSRLAAAVAPGAGGTVPIARLDSAVEAVVRTLGDGLRTDGALGELSDLARDLGRADTGRFPRGETVRARTLVRRLERLLGLTLR